MEVIREGQFEKLPRLAKEGYYFNLVVFDMLRNCGHQDILDKIWNTDFMFLGDSGKLVSYLVNIMGERNAAIFLRDHEECGQVWFHCYKWAVDPRLYVEIEDWDMLVFRSKYYLLVENGKFDEIITKGVGIEAVEVLRENKQEKRIMELGEYRWLLYESWQPEGIQLIADAGKLEEVYEKYTPKCLDAFCYIPEGREFLYSKKEFRTLIHKGFNEVLVAHRQWNTLVENGCFAVIDWADWWKTSSDKALVLNYAKKAKAWAFLADRGKVGLLLKNLQFKLALKALFKKS